MASNPVPQSFSLLALVVLPSFAVVKADLLPPIPPIMMPPRMPPRGSADQWPSPEPSLMSSCHSIAASLFSQAPTIPPPMLPFEASWIMRATPCQEVPPPPTLSAEWSSWTADVASWFTAHSADYSSYLSECQPWALSGAPGGCPTMTPRPGPPGGPPTFGPGGGTGPVFPTRTAPPWFGGGGGGGGGAGSPAQSASVVEGTNPEDTGSAATAASATEIDMGTTAATTESDSATPVATMPTAQLAAGSPRTIGWPVGGLLAVACCASALSWILYMS